MVPDQTVTPAATNFTKADEAAIGLLAPDDPNQPKAGLHEDQVCSECVFYIEGRQFDGFAE